MKAQIILFGLPSWILVDVTWSMISQIARHVPESYSITVYLIFALTIGNLVPLLLNYFFFHENENSNSSSLSKDSPRASQISPPHLSTIITFILSLGFLSGLALALLWNQPITIGSHRYSIPFCFIFFLIGACSSSSNVTHYIFISQFSSKETTNLSTGMALGSMAAGLMGLTQGLVLSSEGFSVSDTFLLLSVFYVPAFFSFLQLSSSAGSESSSSTRSDDSFAHLLNDDKENPSSSSLVHPSSSNLSSSPFSSFYNHHSTLVHFQFFNTLLGYGLIPALISPICSLFKSPALVTLFATSILCILDPLCRSLTAFWSLSSLSQLTSASLILYSLATLLLIPLALSSTASPLLSAPGGGVYAILTYVSFGTLFGFINTSVFLYLKQQSTNLPSHPPISPGPSPGYSIQHAYRFTGIVSQSGALCGSLISLLLVISGAIK
jgi:hypothetical protein